MFTDAIGRVYHLDLGVPQAFRAGLGYTAIGQLCTTTVTTAQDSWCNGMRISPAGRLVVAGLSSPVFNGGLPFNAADGAMARSVDATPVAADPYVGGVRVGAAGVYLTTAVP